MIAEPGGPDPLATERAHRDLPALPFLAESVRGGDPCVGEPHLVEHLVADDVLDGPALDARRLHVDDERGDALVLRAALDGARVGAEQEEAPLGEVRRGDPDLLAVDDVLVAVGDGRGAQVREVGAGLGLAEALAPVLVGREDAGQPLLLLLGVPHAMIIGPICQIPFAL